MKVAIYSDMEGVAGIQSWEYTGGGGARYEEGRRLYTGEINAAVRGCKKAGATEIVAIDGHGGASQGGRSFMNWINEVLEPGAEYVQGYPWVRYIEALEDCEAVLLLAAHSMAGTADGVLCHTVSDAWFCAYVNDRPIGEVGITAAFAGSSDVPVVFVSGDAAVCAEVKATVGDEVTTAQVKVGLGRYAARNLQPDDACRLIEEMACHALLRKDLWPRPLKFDPPVRFRVDFTTPDRTAGYIGRTGVEVVGPRSVQATAPTFWEAWDAFWYRT